MLEIVTMAFGLLNLSVEVSVYIYLVINVYYLLLFFIIEIGIYHNGKLLRQKEVINIEGSSETVECRVSPSPLPTDTKLEWTESRHIIQGQWNDNKTSYQLIVDGSQGSFPKEYHCNATNGKNSMTTSVIFNGKNLS